MKSIIQLCTLLALQAAASPITTHKHEAPVLSAANSIEIPESYIVVFKDHVTSTLASLHHDWVHDIHSLKQSQESQVGNFSKGLKHTYNIPGGLLGYSGSFDDAVIEQIRSHPDVRSAPVLETQLLTNITCHRSSTLRKTPSCTRLLWRRTHLGVLLGYLTDTA